MGKISRTQLNSRLDALEITITGITDLSPDEIKELEAALKLFESTGKFAANQYGDFLKRFEESYGTKEGDDINFQIKDRNL